jgi:hypothetical protein
MSLHPLGKILPQELVNEIFSYDPQHRDNMKLLMNSLMFAHHKWDMHEVFHELLEATELYCDNDMCECSINIQSLDIIETVILGRNCIFCSEDCAGYGEWSIRYDYRKAMRRKRNLEISQLANNIT